MIRKMVARSSSRPGGDNFGGEDAKYIEAALDPLILICAGESSKKTNEYLVNIKIKGGFLLSKIMFDSLLGGHFFLIISQGIRGAMLYVQCP